jgi:pantoate--beta-alanine ligase
MERKAAVVLHQALTEAEAKIRAGETDAAEVRRIISNIIEDEPLARIDYVEVVDWNELQPIEKIDGPVLVAIAVFIGKVRLIDNFIVE